MSIPGRIRAANNIGEICACLAALTSLEKHDFPTVRASLDAFTCPMELQGLDARDDADWSYFRTVAQCFYSEVCCLSADYEPCDRLVQKKWEIVVEYFIDAMLDSNTLERFPSMNLKRMKENGGVRCERKQNLRLKLSNSKRRSKDTAHESVNEAGARLKKTEKGNSPGPAYNSARVWSFSRSLGKAIARKEHGPGALTRDSRFGNLFVELDSDLTMGPRDSIPLVSLEKECMRRFTLFRGILSYSAKHTLAGGAISFESLSHMIIACCCHQLFSISKGVHYQACFGRKEGDNDAKSYKHARLLELQSCYAELTVALLSWILRECPTCRSTTFEATLQSARDQLFSQMLLRKTCNVHQSLQQLYRVATSGAVVNTTAARTLASSEGDESGVQNDVFVAIVRRSREIALHLALDQRSNGMRNIYCLFNSFMTLGTSCRANSYQAGICDEWTFDMIAKSLESDNQGASAISRISVDTSPFQQALDDYMRHVSLNRAASREEPKATYQLRHVAIRQFLVPKLLKEDVQLSQKNGILRLLFNILQIEASKSNFTSQEALEVQLIASMAKGIASCLRSALESPSVDDDLICHAFQCARLSLILPYLSEGSPSDMRQEDTVLSWSRHRKDDTDAGKPPRALYLWTFATWMNDVGKMIVCRTDEDKQRFYDFRAKSVSLTVQGQSIWSDKDTCDDDVVTVSSRLVSLEAKVFVEKENTRPITNVYAKSKPKPQAAVTPRDHAEWNPSSSVRRAAKELQAKVLAVL